MQQRHGARLVGRWRTNDDRIVAVWEYDSSEAYDRIEAAVRLDPDAAAARELRQSFPPLFDTVEQTFMHSTLTQDAAPE